MADDNNEPLFQKPDLRNHNRKLGVRTGHTLRAGRWESRQKHIKRPHATFEIVTQVDTTQARSNQGLTYSLDKKKRWEAIDNLERKFERTLCTKSDGEYSGSSTDSSDDDHEQKEPTISVVRLKVHPTTTTSSETEFKRINEKFRQNANDRLESTTDHRLTRRRQQGDDTAATVETNPGLETEYIVKKNRKGTFLVPKRRSGKKGVHLKSSKCKHSPFSDRVDAVTQSNEIVVVRSQTGAAEYPMFATNYQGGCGRRCEYCYPPPPTRHAKQRDMKNMLMM